MNTDLSLFWEYSLSGNELFNATFTHKDVSWVLLKTSFKEMLEQLQHILFTTTAKQIVVRRRAKTKLFEYLLEEVLVELIRSDIEEAYRRMTWTQPVAPSPKEDVLQLPGLRAGISTLADSFGDEVYILRQEDKLECPFCGRWSSDSPDFTCAACKGSIALKAHGRWYSAKVEDLLASNAPRFFLPRRWNTGNTWISRSDLEELFNQWQKVKES